MTSYLLDTDICILFLRGKYGIGDKIMQIRASNCYVSDITLAELHYGAFKSSNFERHKHDANEIASFATVLSISDSLQLYGKERARLEAIGRPIHDFDLLIATTALHHGMTLVSNNTKHHARVADLQLANWVTS